MINTPLIEIKLKPTARASHISAGRLKNKLHHEPIAFSLWIVTCCQQGQAPRTSSPLLQKKKQLSETTKMAVVFEFYLLNLSPVKENEFHSTKPKISSSRHF